MRVAFITDTHIGTREDEVDTFETLEMLCEEFSVRDVDTVVHLGDIAHEEPQDAYVARVNQVQEVFASEFSFYMTTGNHDAIAMPNSIFKEEFGALVEDVVCREEGVSLILGSSAGDGEFANLGKISDGTLEMLRAELERGNDCVVASHYPLQYTNYYQERPIFRTHPEYTFPVNKHLFTEIVADCISDEQSIELVCGHLHPSRTMRVETDPLSIPLTVLEPVQNFEETETEEIVWSDNRDISVEDLIWDF